MKKIQNGTAIGVSNLITVVVWLPTLNATDCNPPGSSVHGIFQARVLEWGAIAFSDTHTAIYEINKDLLYSTGNYIQHFIINHNEKEYIRACV